MARFKFDEADNYGAAKNNYFGLKDDGDTANIRILYNNINDAEGVATHEITVGDKSIDVECLRAYNEPISNCPLCNANYKVNAKLFIPVYDMDSKESKIWTRGKTFFSKISSLCSHFNPLVSTPFEVERCGKKGDTKTSYEFYPGKTDNSRIVDFPEIKAEGICFQKRTFEELANYLKTGDLSDQNEVSTEQPVRREPVSDRPVRRRPSYDEESF